MAISISQCNSVNLEKTRIRVFDYNQQYMHMYTIYTNVRFQSIGTTSDFGTKFAQNNMNDKNFEKVNIEFEIRDIPNVEISPRH